MGKIIIFSLDTCPYCKKAKELLQARGAEFEEISLTDRPEWRQYMFLLTNGRSSVPEVYFNQTLVGGLDELEKLDQQGKLDSLIADCLRGPPADFPPPFRRPEGKEFLKLVPRELQEKWQSDLESIGPELGGTAERPISSLLIMLETPEEMVVLCTAGDPGTKEFPIGLSGLKGDDGSNKKSYCQVAIERKHTLFFDGPDKRFGELQNCSDWVKYGYGYYIGTPWTVDQLKGTVVAMEKEVGILKKQHIAVIEGLRDKIETEFKQYRDGTHES